jgi:hypothetical protein
MEDNLSQLLTGLCVQLKSDEITLLVNHEYLMNSILYTLSDVSISAMSCIWIAVGELEFGIYFLKTFSQK